MNIIIPMSGIGKRFLEAGYTDPKPLISVEGKPIIQHVVERFDTENDTFIFVCNAPHLAETPMRSVLERIVKNKTIVLTGAMIPIKFGSSDGLFNLGSALAFAQSLPHGVYVVMNGKYFPWNNVKKNLKTGIFEELH